MIYILFHLPNPVVSMSFFKGGWVGNKVAAYQLTSVFTMGSTKQLFWMLGCVLLICMVSIVKAFTLGDSLEYGDTSRILSWSVNGVQDFDPQQSFVKS